MENKYMYKYMLLIIFLFFYLKIINLYNIYIINNNKNIIFKNKLIYFQFKNKNNNYKNINTTCLKLLFIIIKDFNGNNGENKIKFKDVKKNLSLNKTNNNYNAFAKNIIKLKDIYVRFWNSNIDYKLLLKRPKKIGKNFVLKINFELERNFYLYDKYFSEIISKFSYLNSYYSLTFFYFFLVNHFDDTHAPLFFWNFIYSKKYFYKKFNISLTTKASFQVNVVDKIVFDFNSIEDKKKLYICFKSSKYKRFRKKLSIISFSITKNTIK